MALAGFGLALCGSGLAQTPPLAPAQRAPQAPPAGQPSGLPGETVVDAQLAADTMSLATVAAARLADAESCSSARVVNTERVDGKPPQEWRERWTLELCGVVQGVVVQYTADPAGGYFIRVTAPAQE